MICDLERLEKEATEWERLASVIAGPRQRRMAQDQADSLRRHVTATRKAYAAFALANRKMEKVYDR